MLSLRVGRSGVRERVLRDAGQERADRNAHIRAEFAVVLSRPDDDNHCTLRAHRAPDQTKLPALAGQTDARGRARRNQTDPVEKVNSENARYVCVMYYWIVVQYTIYLYYLIYEPNKNVRSTRW